jgi:prepilin-type N-terminal cleavage/methylation domain-containing protein
MPRPRSRKAFSLVEIAVALAIILILAAVALPNVTGYLDQKNVEATAAQLASVRDALYGPSTSFRTVIRKNASRLSFLDSALVNGDDDSCGSNYSGGDRGRWDDTPGGPFMTYSSDRTVGMMTPIGLADDLLTTVGASGTTPRYLRIQFQNQKLTTAQALEMTVDGTPDPNTGWNSNVVRWTPQAGILGEVTLYYFVTIDGTC